MSRVFRELAEALVLALIVFLVIQAGVRNFRVDGESMLPTLKDDQFLLVNKLVYFKLNTSRLSKIIPFWKDDTPSEHFPIHPPKRGEVVVFRNPLNTDQDFVKRVIGLPGEKVEIRRGVTYIDGVPLDEPYLTETDPRTFPPVMLKEKEYFVMGDNRINSNDSRGRIGAVPEENLVGKVSVVYWPISQVQMLDAVWNFTRNALP